MPTEVLAPRRAEQQIGMLSRKHFKAFESFLNDLAASGCKPLPTGSAARHPSITSACSTWSAR
jgi:hypothetical protein